MRKMMMAALCASAMAASAHATVREEPVTYQDGETTMKGFVVFDDAIKASVLGSSWCTSGGVSPSTFTTRRRSSLEQGYTAFIADMYGDAKTADNPKDAGALSSSGDEGLEGDAGAVQRRANPTR